MVPAVVLHAASEWATTQSDQLIYTVQIDTERVQLPQAFPITHTVPGGSRALQKLTQLVISGVDVEKVDAVLRFWGLSSGVELVGMALTAMKWREPVTSLVG